MTALEFEAVLAKQVESMAANGTAWLKAKEAELQAAFDGVRGLPRWANNGTAASLEGQLERVRAAMKMAK